MSRHRHSSSPVHLTTCAGTMLGLVKQQRNAMVLGKLTGQALMATSQPGQNNSRLFFLTNQSFHMRFLVDTVLILPTNFEQQQPQIGVNLQVANNTAITTYGTRSLMLNVGFGRVFCWVFVIADVKRPILGADFLQSNQLLVDVHRKRLVDTSTKFRSSYSRFFSLLS